MDNAKSPLMPLGELFSKSFGIYKERFLILAGIMAVNFTIFLLFLSLFLIFAIIAAVFGISAIALSEIMLVIPIFLFGLLLAAIGIIGAVVIGSWVQVASLCAIKDRDEKIGIKESLMRGKSRILSYFWISFLIGVITLLGALLFIIPGIIFAIWLSFSCYVLVSEGLKGTEALKRSKQLVKGNWWNVFVRLLVMGLIIGFIGGVLGSILPFVGAVLTALFVSPFAYIFGYLLYEDLKSNG